MAGELTKRLVFAPPAFPPGVFWPGKLDTRRWAVEHHYKLPCRIEKKIPRGTPGMPPPECWPHGLSHRTPPAPVRYVSRLVGWLDIRDGDLATFLLFRGTGGVAPDFGAAAYEEYSAHPHTTAALPVSGDYQFTERRQNAYGLQSRDTLSWPLQTDGAGAEVVPAPSPPAHFSINEAPGHKARIRASYDREADGANAADAWLLYIKEDDTPVPGVDAPIEVPMNLSSALVVLDWTSSATYTLNHLVYALVRTRRSGTPDVDSDNSVCKVVSISGQVPPPPRQGDIDPGQVRIG